MYGISARPSHLPLVSGASCHHGFGVKRRCGLLPCPKFRKVQSWHQRHFVMNRCQPGMAAYAPSRTEVPHKQAWVSSPIETQLSAQHQQPAELLALRRHDSSLLLGDDTALLEGLTRTTSVTPHAAGGVILGYSVANGAVASQDFPVGKLKSKRYLACARCKLWWMTPEWGRTAADLPPETQFLLVEVEEGGPYAVLLPLIDTNTFRGTLRPPRWAFPFICNNHAASSK
ncbi:hypothetical protein ABBQ32_001780 [Trebouxia sp. C0010 RCD-2024]